MKKITFLAFFILFGIKGITLAQDVINSVSYSVNEEGKIIIQYNLSIPQKGMQYDISILGTNTSEFSALLACYRYDDGYLYVLGNDADYWSSTENNTLYPSDMTSYYNVSNIFLNYAYKAYGFNVRCCKDN